MRSRHMRFAAALLAAVSLARTKLLLPMVVAVAAGVAAGMAAAAEWGAAMAADSGAATAAASGAVMAAGSTVAAWAWAVAASLHRACKVPPRWVAWAVGPQSAATAAWAAWETSARAA